MDIDCWVRRSKRTDHPLVADVAEVLDVPVLSGQPAAGHRSHVVRMRVSFHQLVADIVSVVRIEAPLQKLIAQTVLEDGRTQHIPNTYPLLFSVLARGGLVPIPRNEVAVQTMPQIEGANHDSPHSKRPVTVDGIFLEISVHLIRNLITEKVLGFP